MAIFKCKMCGGELNIQDNATVASCDYCGTKQTLPRIREDEISNLFNRANNLRIRSEFDKAEQIYEKILNRDETEAEAHWGIVLCRYGIEYVEDPATFQRIPTCHRTSYDAVTADANYLSALQYADPQQKALYQQQALAIETVQKNILRIVEKELPFDVFICYKETDENGKRTPDSVIANDIYYQLTDEGFKVFYAAITLEEKLGQEYEPYIFSALTSAKVMLVIGSKPEYFSAVWVRNEWSRFLKLIRKDRSKLLIPCYKDMDPYDLPEEFAHLQAQDMGKIGFITDLIRGIRKIMPQKTEPQPVIPPEPASKPELGNKEALLKRGFLSLEDKEWKKADYFFEQALNFDAECSDAYLGKQLAALQMQSVNELENYPALVDQFRLFQKALRFAQGSQKELLQAVGEKNREMFQNTLNNKMCKPIYDKAIQRAENYKNLFYAYDLRKKMIYQSIKELNNIPYYQDATEKAKEYTEYLATMDDDSKSSGGCYIATCVYGSYDCPQVWTLRRFRDYALGETWAGRLFIRTYYAVSPRLVEWFGHTRLFQKVWRFCLDRLVSKLQLQGYEDSPYQDRSDF